MEMVKKFLPMVLVSLVVIVGYEMYKKWDAKRKLEGASSDAGASAE